MDRQLVLIIAAAIVGLTLIGVVYLGPSSTRIPVAHARGAYAAEYSPDDIRYKFRKKEEDYARKHKGRMPPPEQITPDVSAPAKETDSSGGPKFDESVEHEAAEEPPIE